MRFPYKDDLPIVRVKVIGQIETEVDAHIDFASSLTILPGRMAEALGLKFATFSSVATGGGIVVMPRYEAKLELLEKRFDLVIGCLELPAETPISALLGRDVLDSFRVCLNGKRKEVEFTDA